MKEAIINNELRLSYPDDFELMDDSKLREAYQNDDTDRWAVRNTDKHIMIAVLWQKSSILLAALADLEGVARKNEQLMKRGLERYGYKCNGFFSDKVCGQDAQGYSYEYVNHEKEQHAKTLLFRAGGNIYGVTCYTRDESDDEAAERFSSLLESIQVI